MTARQTTARTGRRTVKPQPAARTAEDVARMAPATKDMPSTHELGAELEATAQAAGRFWRALGEACLPPGFRVAMFDNWQKKYWEADDATSVKDETDPEYDEPEPV